MGRTQGRRGDRLWESKKAGGKPWLLTGPQKLMEASPTSLTALGPQAHAMGAVGQSFFKVRLWFHPPWSVSDSSSSDWFCILPVRGA